MKCFYHTDVDAVASCQLCGKGLCKECAAKYSPCLCDECNITVQQDKKAQKQLKRRSALIDTHTELIKAVITGIICSVIVTYIFGLMSSDDVPMSVSVMFFFLPFGWKLITYVEQWLPGILMSGPVFIIYLCIKFALSMFLGIFCFMYQIIKYVLKLIKASTTK